VQQAILLQAATEAQAVAARAVEEAEEDNLNMKKLWKLILAILLCELIGFISSFFTVSSISSWYAVLNKPSFNPPNYIFGPVWTLLYALIGISLYFVLTAKAKKDLKKKAYLIFTIQLILNFFWSIIFFGMHQILPAFIEIIFLWLAILINMIVFHKISRLSTWLLMPYWLWVSFASLLNFSLWMLNR
jgi:tryptophan-rich sensory protein